jgi:hypothetical protein
MGTTHEFDLMSSVPVRQGNIARRVSRTPASGSRSSNVASSGASATTGPAPGYSRAPRPLRKSAPEHNWWDWYAAYLNARLEGSSSEEASQAAGVYMEGILGAR